VEGEVTYLEGEVVAIPRHLYDLPRLYRPMYRPALGIKTSTRIGTIMPRLSMVWTMVVVVAPAAVLEVSIGVV
jgi:hypothetical protein